MTFRRRLVAYLVALLLGGLTAVVALTWRTEVAGNPAGDRVLAAVEGLEDDQVHVAEDGREFFDEEAEATIAAAIAERDVPVYVVAWRSSWNAGYDHDLEAADQILEHLPEASVLVMWQGPEDSLTQTRAGYRVTSGEDFDREPRPAYVGDPERRLLEWLDQLPEDPVQGARSDENRWAESMGLGIGLSIPVLFLVWCLLRLVDWLSRRRHARES